MSVDHDHTPPVGEELHVPESSILPVLIAAALTLFLLGLTKSVFVWGFATIVLVALIGRWVAGAVREHRSLPAHHEH